jgi:hypothetical protein
VRYECPMIMNMADEVCKVHSKFDRGYLKSIAEDHDDRGGFSNVCMAHNLIEMHNMDLLKIS